MTMQPELYAVFERAEWATLRANTPLTLADADLEALRGANEHVSLAEVADIYLPLSRLLNLHVAARRNLTRVTDAFLGRPVGRPPYVVAVAGSVAVGKSTFARVLQAILSRWPDHPHVELVTTDGFLHPNRYLEERGLMGRKGFPESYDRRRMVAFLAGLKSGAPEVTAPVYSHVAYDIVPGELQRVSRPDIVVFEGLNVLQPGGGDRTDSVVASDFFDFSIYLDADEADIRAWYQERFRVLQRTAFQKPDSYFRRYRDLDAGAAERVSGRIWAEINGVNLRENILPTRERARVVLRKAADHGVREVWLRQV